MFMLKNIKDKKIIVILGAILLILLVISAIVIIIKVNKSKETKEVIQQIEQLEQEETEPIMTQIQEESLEEPPFLIDEMTDEIEEEKEEPETKKVTQTSKYYIKVNNQANVVTIYTKDSNGNYTVPYKAMICSIGTATPTGGIYTIPGKTWDRWTWGQMVGGVWAQYYVRIKGSILFHSVPYVSKDKSTLEYWEYDKLGTKASAGCIRLTVADAKWIYDNCPAGTQVEFYYDSNPGPLGKPTAQKISGEESVRGWDPTDPSSGNPWKNYVPPVVEQPENPVVEEPEQPPVVETPEEENPEEKPPEEENTEEQPPEEENPEEQPPKEPGEDIDKEEPTDKPGEDIDEEQPPKEEPDKEKIEKEDNEKQLK